MTEEQDPLQARLTLLVPLNNLSTAQQDQVLQNAEIIDIKKKDYVFRQGDRDGWSFYIIEGEVELYADDQLIKRVVGGEGASFQALAQLQPRQMSAQARSKLKVLRVDRGLLDRLLSVESNPRSTVPDIEVTEIESSATGDWLTEMLQSELFAHVPPSNIQRLLETLETVEFKAGEVVIEQGAPGDYYYAIQSGRCEVLRSAKNGKPIKLAELQPGARFGEEALVSNAKRNATVKMLTDGELARLTKEEFVELIKTPVMRSCTLDEARALVAEGARWLDVRYPEEQAANGLENSVNIPLSNLRSSHHELDREQYYVAYCDTGGRSSAAAFLLTQEGFEVSYVEGGAIDEVPPEQSAKIADKKRAEKRDEPPKPEPSTPQDEIVDADIRAQSLAADLEKANLQIEQAQRVMAEAQAAKLEADRLVSEKLQEERAKMAAEQTARQEADRLAAEKLQAERATMAAAQAAKEESDRQVAEQLKAEAVKLAAEKTLKQEAGRLAAEMLQEELAKMAAAQALKEESDRQIAEELQAERAEIAEALAAKEIADREAAEILRAERAKMEEEAAAVETRLAEARRLKDEIERQQALAAEEAELRHREQEERTAAIEREAEARLQQEEERIEELYRQQAEKLEALELEREKSQTDLAGAWAAIETEATLTKERLEAAQELEAELLRVEQQRAAELEERENQMRAALQAEIDNERKKLEAEFARTAEQIERAHRDQEAAAAAKKGAAEEAQRIIQEYKQAQEAMQAEQTAKLVEQRQQIEKDAERLKVQLEEAARARAEAESIKREAETQLADTLQRHQSIDATEVSLRDEIEAIEARARAATERLRNAVAVENNAETRHRESEQRLERTYGTKNEINLLLQKELDEWVSEQERIQGSTAQRHELDKQMRQTERIKNRAVEAQRENVKHDRNLLDEIAEQLNSGS